MIMIEKLFMSAIEISLWLSVVIILLKITSPFIKKTYAAKWRYIIWLIIAVRLAAPFNITLPSAPVRLTVPDNKIVFRQPFNPVNNMPEQSINLTVDDIQPVHMTEQQIPAPAAPEYAAYTYSVTEIAAFVWLSGIILFAFYQFKIYNAFRKKMRRWSMPVADAEILAVFERVCLELKIKNKPDIKICRTAGSPMMSGFIRPVLYLQNIEYTDKQSLEVVLKHELVHYKRRDLWFKLLLLAANAVHWFNPLVYLMLKSSNDDIEFSCDDEVIKNADIDFRKTYSQLILESIKKEKAHCIALTTQFKSGKKTIKNRFSNILDTSKKRKGRATLYFITVLLFLGGMCVTYTVSSLNTERIKILVEPVLEYDKINYFNDGLMAVEKDYKWGFIDTAGKLIAPCIYNEVSDFKEGFAAVRKGGKWGYVNQKGKIVVPLEYDGADSFSEGLAAVKKGGMWGFINTKGEFIIPCVYSSVLNFNEGLAVAVKDRKCGYIDRTGRIVLPFEYDQVLNFENGIGIVKKGDKFGFINRAGNFVVPCIYERILNIGDGLATACKNGKWGIIDNNGNIIIDFIYDGSIYFFDDVAVVSENEKFMLIDKSGGIVYAPDDGSGFSSFSDGLATVRKDDKMGFIDKTGNFVVPPIYNAVSMFNEGVALVEKDEKCGLIDTSGDIVVPLIYDVIGEVKGGITWVRNNNKFGIIDKSGNILLPLEYDNLSIINENLVCVGQNGKWGIVQLNITDESGNILLPLEYDNLNIINENLAFVRKDGKWGIIQY